MDDFLKGPFSTGIPFAKQIPFGTLSKILQILLTLAKNHDTISNRKREIIALRMPACSSDLTESTSWHHSGEGLVVSERAIKGERVIKSKRQKDNEQ